MNSKSKGIVLKNIKPAKRYATALIELKDRVDLAEILSDLKLISNTLEQNPNLNLLLNHPIVSVADKKESITRIFQDKIKTETYNFTMVLIENKRFNLFDSILSRYEEELNKLNNISSAQIASAIKLDDTIKETIIKKLENKFNKTINAEFEIKEEILGGLVIKIQDTIIDLSLKKRFEIK